MAIYSYSAADTAAVVWLTTPDTALVLLLLLILVLVLGVTKIPSRRTWKSAGCSHPLSAPTHKTARTGGHNANKQSSSSKTQELRFSSINVQSARGRLNPQATSVPGHVIVAQGSATPESGSTLTNSFTDDDIDNRSVDFDSAVQN